MISVKRKGIINLLCEVGFNNMIRKKVDWFEINEIDCWFF